MADTVNKKVTITISAYDETGSAISKIAANLLGLQKALTSVDTGLAKVASLTKSIGDSFKGVRLDQLGVERFANDIKFLEGIDGKKIANVASGIKKLNGIVIDPSISNLSILKELSGITFPSFQKVLTLIAKLREGGPTIDLKGLAEGLTALSTVKIPNSIKALGTTLKELQGITGFADLSKVAASFTQFSLISRLPALGPFVKNLKDLSAIQLFPDLTGVVSALNQAKSIGKLPNINTFVTGLKKLEAGGLKIDTAKLEAIAKAFAGFANIGNVPSITTFVSSLKKLQGLQIPSMGQLVAQIQKLGTAFSQISAATPFINAMNQIGQASQNVTQHINTLTRAGNQQHTMWERLGQKVKNYIGYRLIADSIIYLKEAFTAGNQSIIDYDQGLKNLQAITGATGEEVHRMGLKLERVASTTKFSASEVADGMVILGQAGQTAEESIKTIGAVSDLATGTLSSMQVSVDLVTSALIVFGIEAGNSARVADVFANAVNKSKLTIEKLVTALNYVGPVASDLGLSLEETSAALGILSNAGLRASTIGTGLRRVLSELADPSAKMKDAIERAGLSVEDLDPRMQGFSKVVENLGIVISDTSVAFDLFGKYGASASLTLTESMSGGFQKMLNEVKRYGTAQDMARIQMEGLGVTLKNFKDKMSLVAVALGKAGAISGMKSFLEVAKDLADGLVWLVENAIGPFIAVISQMPATLQVLTYSVVGLSLAFGGLGKALVSLKIIAAWNAIASFTAITIQAIGSVGLLTGAVIRLRAALALIGGPVTLVIGALASLVGVIGYVSTKSDRLINTFERQRTVYLEVTESIKGYIDEIDRLDEIPNTEEERLALVDRLAAKFPELTAEVMATNGNLTELAEVMKRFSTNQGDQFLKDEIVALEGYTGKVRSAISYLDELEQAKKRVDSGEKEAPVTKGLKTTMMDADKIAAETGKAKKELENQLAIIADIMVKAENILGEPVDPEKYISKFLGVDVMTHSRETVDAILKEVERLKEGIKEAETAQGEIIDYGLAGKWKKELEDSTSIYNDFVNNKVALEKRAGAEISELAKGINAQTIAAHLEEQEYFANEIRLNEERHKKKLISDKEYFAKKKELDEESRKFDTEASKKDSPDNSVYLLKQVETLTAFKLSEERKISKETKAGTQERLNAEYKLYVQLQKRMEAVRRGYGADDPKEVLKAIAHANSLKEKEEKRYFDTLDKQRAEGLLSEYETEKRKLDATIKRINGQIAAQEAANKLIADSQNSDEQRKAEEELDALRTELSNAQADRIKKNAEYTLEVMKDAFEKEKSLREKALASSESGIADIEASGAISHEEALRRKAALTLAYYQKEAQIAAIHADLLKERMGEEDDEYQKALEAKIEAETKYYEERTKLLDEYVEDREKAIEDLEEFDKNYLREQEDYEKKFVDLGKKSSNDLVKAERTYAEKISEINEKLVKKIEDLDRDRTEKYKEFAKKRKEAEEDSAASILMWQEKIADKIREVEGRDKSDRSKDHANEEAAADKLRRGLELLAQARREQNKEAYEAGKELIEQSAELYGDLENKKRSIKGLQQAAAAGSEVYETEEQLKKRDIDDDKADVDSKYDYEKEKAEKAAKDELEDAANTRKNRVKEIQEVYAEEAAQEKLRHERVMEDFEIEKNKLIEILNTANAIIAQTTGNVKLGNQIDTGKEAQKTTGEQPQIDWSEHMTIDPTTGQKIFKAVADQVKEAASASGNSIEVPVTPVESQGATAIENVTAMVDNLRVDLTTPFQVTFAVSGIELLQQAIDLIAQIKDKTVTITTKYVPEGSSGSSSTTTAPIATAFNGGLIGFFRNGGNVFKKLASPFISAGRGFLDDVPAMLSRNEFVHRARAVREYGVGFMRSVNDLRFPKELARGFAGGGLAGVDGISSLAGLTGNFVVPDALVNGLRSTIDNSSISTYNVTIGDKALRPRGRVANLTNNLLKEVRKQY